MQYTAIKSLLTSVAGLTFSSSLPFSFESNFPGKRNKAIDVDTIRCFSS